MEDLHRVHVGGRHPEEEAAAHHQCATELGDPRHLHVVAAAAGRRCGGVRRNGEVRLVAVGVRHRRRRGVVVTGLLRLGDGATCTLRSLWWVEIDRLPLLLAMVQDLAEAATRKQTTGHATIQRKAATRANVENVTVNNNAIQRNAAAAKAAAKEKTEETETGTAEVGEVNETRNTGVVETVKRVVKMTIAASVRFPKAKRRERSERKKRDPKKTSR